ncbi:MAG: MarR family transcriptional regulator [Rhodobacteraceae bacterium]|nr:MarR family transcriptional regulator [Paracoccaceae bacterium]MBR26428.1 MarR family transcriptional regulator [Paracoccaceae bacterium]
MSFDPDHQAETLRGAIGALSQRFKSAEAQLSAGRPLNPLDMQILLFVAERPGCGPSDLARGLGAAATTISSATDRLHRQGLLVRDRPEQDRRAIRLSLSPAGRDYAEALLAVQRDHCRQMLDRLDPEEQATLLRIFTKLASFEL